MTTNSAFMPSRLTNYKLSSSYPNVKSLNSKQLNCNGSFSFNSYTKSWSNYQNIALKTADNLRIQDMTYNSDLQPLNWLQKESIIDIDPLDIEEDLKDESGTPGYEDLINPQITLARVEVESQENSNIHDFVRFQAMRNSMNNNNNRVALRSNNSFGDCAQNYSHQASGFVKPNLSYTQLIFMAIETCKDRAMTVNDIYQWCEVNYPYYKHIGPSWKNSLRHNLSINKSFRRMPRDGQSQFSSYEMSSGDDMGEDAGPHNAKQGGPGRGAYWVVDDKERKNLLDSIYRAHQAMPLADRNGARVESPPYSLFVNPPPKHGPMLRIDGRFTDASTYLQSKRSDDDPLATAAAAAAVANENHIHSQTGQQQHGPSKHEPANCGPPDNADAEYASMMYSLAGAANSSGSPDVGDASLKLSASYNSTNSRLEDADGELQKPRPKNRRKSHHDKVRNYTECAADSASGGGGRPSRPTAAGAGGGGHGGITSVNVIIAPHFDHIYARYQQFLRPAIPSDMDTVQQGGMAGAGGGGGGSNEPDVEFLRRGAAGSDHDRDYDCEDDDDDNDYGDDDESGEDRDCGERRLVMAMDTAPSPLVEVKRESEEPTEFTVRRMAMAAHPGSRRMRLSQASVAFTRKRKVQRVLARRTSRRSVRRGSAAPAPRQHHSQQQQQRDRDQHRRQHSLRSARRVKREPVEPELARATEQQQHQIEDRDEAAVGDPHLTGGVVNGNSNAEAASSRTSPPPPPPSVSLNNEGGAACVPVPAVSVLGGAHRDEDGYRTDSTMPMVVAARRRQARTSGRLLTTPARRRQSGHRPATGTGSSAAAAGARTGPVPEKRCRSKRKRTRPLRIDESAEMAAIEFLASLEQRQQKCRNNLENLYQFNAFLKSSLGTAATVATATASGDSSCSSSSVVLVSE